MSQQVRVTRELKVGQHSVANVAKITQMSCYTVNIDPSSIAQGEGITTIMAAAEAELGDFCLVSAPYDLVDITATAYVLDSGNVEILLNQTSTATNVDLAADDWKVLLIKAAPG